MRTHRRLAGPVVLASLAVLLAAGCSEGTPPERQSAPDAPTLPAAAAPAAGSEPAATTTEKASTPAETGTTKTGTADKSATVVPAKRSGDRVVDFFGAKVVVPAGWTFEPAEDGLACLEANGSDGCAIKLLNPVEVDRAQATIDISPPDADFGWWLGTDVAGCTDAGLSRKGEDDYSLLQSTVAQKGLRPLGTKKALYRTYSLRCEDGRKADDARLWSLPTSKLTVIQEPYAQVSDAEVDRFVAQLDASGYKA